MHYWSRELGVGPWFYNPRVPIVNYRYRGQALRAAQLGGAGQLRPAAGRADPDAQRRAVDVPRLPQAGRTGVQHVAYWTEDFDADLARLQAQGFDAVMSGEVGERGRFVYFDADANSGTVIELSEVAGPKGRMFTLIREASLGLGRARSGARVPGPAHALAMAQAPVRTRRRTADGHVRAVYVIETPLDPAAVAEVLAGEQSSGTFLRVAGESDALRARARAIVEQRRDAGAGRDAEPAECLARAQGAFPVRGGAPASPSRSRSPTSARNLPTLAATVAGNLFDLGETTGVRLTSLALPAAYRDRFARPRQGIAGTRRTTGVHGRPLIGTIIKPNVGMKRPTRRRRWSTSCARPASTSSRTTRSAPIRARAARATRAGRDGERQAPPGPHRPHRDDGVQHHRRHRRDAPPRRSRGARRRHLRDGEPQLVRAGRGPGTAPVHADWPSTDTATASAR